MLISRESACISCANQAASFCLTVSGNLDVKADAGIDIRGYLLLVYQSFNTIPHFGIIESWFLARLTNLRGQYPNTLTGWFFFFCISHQHLMRLSRCGCLGGWGNNAIDFVVVIEVYGRLSTIQKDRYPSPISWFLTNLEGICSENNVEQNNESHPTSWNSPTYQLSSCLNQSHGLVAHVFPGQGVISMLDLLGKTHPLFEAKV